jgi:carbamoylphosphate synthase large subunit
MAEEKARFDELLKTFSPTQLDFIAVRMTAKNDKEAAETIGISPDVVYAWPDKQAVNEAVRLAKQNGVSVAREKLVRLASKAVDTIEAAMGDKKNPGLSAALAVLDRVGLPEVKRQEMSGAGGGPLVVEYINDWRGASEGE